MGGSAPRRGQAASRLAKRPAMTPAEPGACCARSATPSPPCSPPPGHQGLSSHPYRHWPPPRQHARRLLGAAGGSCAQCRGGALGDAAVAAPGASSGMARGETRQAATARLPPPGCRCFMPCFAPVLTWTPLLRPLHWCRTLARRSARRLMSLSRWAARGAGRGAPGGRTRRQGRVLNETAEESLLWVDAAGARALHPGLVAPATPTPLLPRYPAPLYLNTPALLHPNTFAPPQAGGD